MASTPARPRFFGAPIGEVAFQAARSLHKHVSRIKSFGYARPPIARPTYAQFTVGIGDGRNLLVTVSEEPLLDGPASLTQRPSTDSPWDYDALHAAYLKLADQFDALTGAH